MNLLRTFFISNIESGITGTNLTTKATEEFKEFLNKQLDTFPIKSTQSPLNGSVFSHVKTFIYNKNSNEKLECIKTADVLLKIVNDLKKLNEDFLIQEVKNVFLVQYDYEYTEDRLWYIFTEVR